MSWSVTLNVINEDTEIPADVVEYFMSQHMLYPTDMFIALDMAKRAGMKSGVLTGMRTPNPAGGPEVIDISIRGFVEALDVQQVIKDIITRGPHAQ